MTDKTAIQRIQELDRERAELFEQAKEEALRTATQAVDILSFFEEHEPFINYASSRGRVGGFLPISIC